jgi:transposase
MQTIATIGLDIAKSVFQVHGVDAAGQVVVRRQLKRRQVLGFFAKLSPSLIGIEACASSHYWARQLQALGHTVRLIPPAYVKPYVKRQKNDAADAEAIRGGHYGQRPRVPRSKAEHMAAPTNAALVKKTLANPEPSTHGPNPEVLVDVKRVRLRG